MNAKKPEETCWTGMFKPLSRPESPTQDLHRRLDLLEEHHLLQHHEDFCAGMGLPLHGTTALGSLQGSSQPPPRLTGPCSTGVPRPSAQTPGHRGLWIYGTASREPAGGSAHLYVQRGSWMPVRVNSG